MTTRARFYPRFASKHHRQRGSALLTGLIFAVIIVITLVSSISLSTQSLKMAHRTFFADAANNLAETGLEEAVWSFNTMGHSTSSTVVDTAWAGWTRTGMLADVYMAGKGDGYSSVPTVSFSGGGGTGAAGTANLVTYYTTDSSTGAVITHVGIAGITLTNRGSGYTSAPTVTLSGGGATLAATAVARLPATRTFTFNGLDQQASGIVKVWVAGYDGSAAVPNIVAKAIITPFGGREPPIEKSIKVILSKNGVLPKGVVAKLGINWNGHPFADSFISNATPGLPPFAPWTAGTARDNTTLASLGGTIDLSQGTVSGNVMTGPGVTVTGNGTITGQQIGNFSYDFTMPAYPTTSGYNLGASVPTILPRPADISGGTAVARTAAEIATGQPPVITGGTVTRAADVPAADGVYYYYVNGATIGNVTITAGKNVVIVGSNNTRLRAGVKVPANNGVSPGVVGSLKIYMDGNIDLTGQRVDQPNCQSLC